MLATSDFKINNDNQEILPMDSEQFPYLCNYAELDTYVEKCIPWHWHSSFEFDYIEEGEVELRTSDQVYILKKGDVFFVNSNVLHAIHAKDKQNGCKIYAHIFDMHFLSGMYNSLLEQKYMFPIIKSKELQVFIIRPDSYRRICMLEKLLKMIELAREEHFGYEFEIRSELCHVWCMLLEETEELRSQIIEKNYADVERIKVMLRYIHQNYMEKITLEDISSAANISDRECARCFQRSIEMSPINYLNDYRIRMASQMLLQTNDSIITISENCGFSSVSYFGKVFQKAMHCTPKEYRKGDSK
ncbi:MAG: helix-turn-helix domain-containing protein [Oliverpabstia sp.]